MYFRSGPVLALRFYMFLSLGKRVHAILMRSAFIWLVWTYFGGKPGFSIFFLKTCNFEDVFSCCWCVLGYISMFWVFQSDSVSVSVCMNILEYIFKMFLLNMFLFFGMLKFWKHVFVISQRWKIIKQVIHKGSKHGSTIINKSIQNYTLDRFRFRANSEEHWISFWNHFG